MLILVALMLMLGFGAISLLGVLLIGASGFLFVFGDLIIAIVVIVFIVKKVRNQKK